MNFNFSRGGGQRQHTENGHEEDYYKILEINHDASYDEIKKAYRKLSMIHHPDKNESSEESNIKFKQLAAAYETLSDPDKRRMYDMGIRSGNGISFEDFENININPYDIFNMIFGLSQQQQQQEQQHHFNHSNIHDFGFPPGFASFIKVGNGMMPMSMPMSMPMGMGIHIINSENLSSSSGLNFHAHPHHSHPQTQTQTQTQTYMSNRNESEVITKNIYINLETAYTGNDKYILKMDEEPKTIQVCIPHGVNDKEVIILSTPSYRTIHVIVNIEPHNLFKRNELDLIIEKEITLKESFCGFEFTINHLNNKSFHLQHKDGTIIKNGVSKTIKKLGMVNNKNVGNLIIMFKVIYPDKLSREQIEKLSEIL